MEIRNHILGQGFGMNPEDDEADLRVRVLDDEAAKISAYVTPAGNDPYADRGLNLSSGSAIDDTVEDRDFRRTDDTLL
jgi:hypothetical protein